MSRTCSRDYCIAAQTASGSAFTNTQIRSPHPLSAAIEFWLLCRWAQAATDRLTSSTVKANSDLAVDQSQSQQPCLLTNWSIQRIISIDILLTYLLNCLLKPITCTRFVHFIHVLHHCYKPVRIHTCVQLTVTLDIVASRTQPVRWSRNRPYTCIAALFQKYGLWYYWKLQISLSKSASHVTQGQNVVCRDFVFCVCCYIFIFWLFVW